MTYPVLGDFELGKTIFFPFHTFNSSGASVTLTGLATSDILVYKNASMTQRSSTAGFTLVDTDGIDIDSVTGLHGFTIDTSDNTDAGFYAAGNDYTVVVSTVTIDSQTVTFIAGRFSIINRAGSNLLITNGTLSGTHSSATMDLGTNAPAKDIGGCVVFVPARQLVCFVDSYNTGTGVVAFSPSTTETLTNGDAWYLFAAPKPSTGAPPSTNAIQLAGQTVTAAAGVTFPSSVASPTNITAGTITTVTNLTNAPTSGDLTATMKSSVTTATPTAALIAAAVWDLATSGHATASTFGAQVKTLLDAIAGYLDTEVAAIKTKTDQLTFTKANELDANVQSINGATVTGDGNATPWDGA